MTKNNIITGILLIAAIISVTAHFRQDSEIRRLQSERFQKQTDALEQQLEQTSRRLERSEVMRDSLNLLSDSILSLVLAGNTKLLEKDREIAMIKGRYEKVSVDSLALIMDERAANANR